MPQVRIPATFIRGGTSRGLFFLREDLPSDEADWDAIFLAALGSPDPHGPVRRPSRDLDVAHRHCLPHGGSR